MFFNKKMARLFLLKLVFSIPGAIVAMEIVSFVETVEQLAPFSNHPIDFIPQYVYENPNQYKKYSWSDGTFAKLKTAVINTSEEAIKKQVKFSSNIESAEEKLKNKEKYEQTAESYDWIYTLVSIEKKLLKRGVEKLTIDDLIEINSQISRFIFQERGIRKEPYQWVTIKESTLALDIIYDYFEDNSKSIFNNKDKLVKLVIKDDKKCVSVQDLIGVLKHKAGESTKVKDQRGRILDISEPKAWAKSQGNKDLLDIKKWYESFSIFFTEPKKIGFELQALMDYIRKSEFIHPLEKAINVWYEIIRIHPFWQAHKRTAKAVASIILLQNGYLPPLITKENEIEYTDVLIEDFKTGKGPVKFTKFIIRLINETQENFKGKDLK